MKFSYARQTINSPNPIARLAHRNRLKKSIQFVESLFPGGKILDYGCGRGDFLLQLQSRKGHTCYGYEPFMEEKVDNVRIYRKINDIKQFAPFDGITLLETIEHLTEHEMDDFIFFAREVLSDRGKILISAPIEIGPALFIKEINRSLLIRFKFPEHRMGELIYAAVFGIAAKRAEDVKISHKGFDFRQAIRSLENKGLKISILGYGPFPIRTWWGNSQVYFYAR